MNYATITSKGQLTIPKAIRQKLQLATGVKIALYPTADGFVGKPKRKSRILDILGDLKYLDKGEPLSKIREKTQMLATEEIVRKLK